MGAETRPELSHLRCARLASMRPRHDGRGNQWDGLRWRAVRLASMRPRHDGRGNPRDRRRLSSVAVASMRPRHDGRGNSCWNGLTWTATWRFNEAAPRWARKRYADLHVPSSVSMRPRHDGRGNTPRSPNTPTSASSFNEAAPRWARKPAGEGARILVYGRLQ